ncbi:hypothetical protein FS749_000745 [Ceratobasidium sp. UAMH 11750]|nr:hypothetical protein FS749_000745 [Ceratobasidium sp. UAMH 11750]
MSKSLSEKKKAIKRRKRLDSDEDEDEDEEDGPAFGFGDDEKDEYEGEHDWEGKEDDDDDDELEAENARLHKELKHFKKQLAQVRRYCEQEGIHDILNTNATPGASGSGSRSQAPPNHRSIRELSIFEEEEDPTGKIPLPAKKSDVTISDIRDMMGLSGRKGSKRWLELRASARVFIHCAY